MSEERSNPWSLMFLVLENICIFGGTLYLVAWQGWSPWWLLGAYLISNKFNRVKV